MLLGLGDMLGLGAQVDDMFDLIGVFEGVLFARRGIVWLAGR